MKAIIAIIVSFILFCSCSTKTLRIPIETVRTEYVYDKSVDSVYVRDSVDRWMKGDTLFIYKEHTKFKYLNRTDTVCKTDTVTKYVRVKVKEEVEVNHIYWYQKVLMWIGGISALLLGGILIYKIKS